MNLNLPKLGLVASLVLTSTYSTSPAAETLREGGGERPPKYEPRPPRPEPRPPRPEPRPPRPEPRPPRPEPRPPRPEPRPPRPEPRPPRPEPRPPRPEPRPPRPNPGPVEYELFAHVNQTLGSYQTLSLNRYFNLYAYDGMRIDSVIVTGTAYEPSDLYLVADRNVEVSESVSYGVFNSWLIPYRSLYLRSNVWELELMVPRFGQVHIETLRLRLVRY